MCEPWYRRGRDAGEGGYNESSMGHDEFQEVALGSPESETTKPLVTATGRLQRENNTLRDRLAALESVSTQARHIESRLACTATLNITQGKVLHYP